MTRRLDPADRKRTTSFTLRPDLLAALDDVASALDRSRNWTAETAIRTFIETTSALAEVAPSARPAPEPPASFSLSSSQVCARGRNLNGVGFVPPLSRDRGQNIPETTNMDDPVRETRLFHAHGVQRVLRHEGEKAAETGRARSEALNRAAREIGKYSQ